MCVDVEHVNTSTVQVPRERAQKVMMMMMMFIGTEILVTQLVCEISRMQAC
jgi:hypothetical protein